MIWNKYIYLLRSKTKNTLLELDVWSVISIVLLHRLILIPSMLYAVICMVIDSWITTDVSNAHCLIFLIQRSAIAWQISRTTIRWVESPWFYNCEFPLSSRIIASFNRIRSDHSSLNSSLRRCNIVQSDLCRRGEGPDTAV